MIYREWERERKLRPDLNKNLGSLTPVCKVHHNLDAVALVKFEINFPSNLFYERSDFYHFARDIPAVIGIIVFNGDGNVVVFLYCSDSYTAIVAAIDSILKEFTEN